MIDSNTSQGFRLFVHDKAQICFQLWMLEHISKCLLLEVPRITQHCPCWKPNWLSFPKEFLPVCYPDNGTSIQPLIKSKTSLLFTSERLCWFFVLQIAFVFWIKVLCTNSVVCEVLYYSWLDPGASPFFPG